MNYVFSVACLIYFSRFSSIALLMFYAPLHIPFMILHLIASEAYQSLLNFVEYTFFSKILFSLLSRIQWSNDDISQSLLKKIPNEILYKKLCLLNWVIVKLCILLKILTLSCLMLDLTFCWLLLHHCKHHSVRTVYKELMSPRSLSCSDQNENCDNKDSRLYFWDCVWSEKMADQTHSSNSASQSSSTTSSTSSSSSSS